MVYFSLIGFLFVLAIAGECEHNDISVIFRWSLIFLVASSLSVLPRSLHARYVDPSKLPAQCQSNCLPFVNALNVKFNCASGIVRWPIEGLALDMYNP